MNYESAFRGDTDAMIRQRFKKPVTVAEELGIPKSRVYKAIEEKRVATFDIDGIIFIDFGKDKTVMWRLHLLNGDIHKKMLEDVDEK